MSRTGKVGDFPLKASNWCCSRCQVTNVDFEWTIPSIALPFQACLKSTQFATKETPSVKWSLRLKSRQNITLDLCCSETTNKFHPSLARLAILNKNLELMFPTEMCYSSREDLYNSPVHFTSKEGIVIDINYLQERADELLPNGNLTIYCKIEQLIIEETLSGQTS